LLISLGISTGNINKWREGAVPNGDTVIKIAKAIGCTTDYLLERDEKITAYDQDNNPVIIDRETMNILERIKADPDAKLFFSTNKDVKMEDLVLALKIIKGLKNQDEGK